jgi:hypothetical protein
MRCTERRSRARGASRSSRPAHRRSRRPRTCSRPTPAAIRSSPARCAVAAGRSLGRGAADAAAGYPSRALEERLEETRAEVLVELGLAKRLIDGPAAAEHLAEGLALLDEPARRAEVALELGGVLFYLARLPDAIAVYQRALEEASRETHPELRERLEAELIASAWWTPDTFPLAQERLAALDLDALHGGFGSDSPLLADTASSGPPRSDRARRSQQAAGSPQANSSERRPRPRTRPSRSSAPEYSTKHSAPTTPRSTRRSAATSSGRLSRLPRPGEAVWRPRRALADIGLARDRRAARDGAALRGAFLTHTLLDRGGVGAAAATPGWSCPRCR